MSEPRKWREYAQGRRSDQVLLLLTLLLAVFIDLTVAIGVGVAVGLAIRFSRRPTIPSDWTPLER
jgi:SulP family sulfate permease